MRDNKKTRERITGEDSGNSIIFNRHLAAYKYAASYVDRKKSVLDLGCSDGYGSFLIAKISKETVALDIDKKTIEDARKKYSMANLKFVLGNALSLKWKNKFDIVVSFQVIEHIEDVNLYLHQIKKVLKKGGIFILSTPNRLLRLRNGEKPWNKFHIHEFEKEELTSFLKKHFSKIEAMGLHSSEDIYEAERKRLYIRRLIAKFDLFDFYSHLPREFTDRIVGLIKKLTLRKKDKKTTNQNDFWFSKDKVDISLDLLSVCTK
ncbi:MAG: methyltransferase domain-containing protein [Candidatus Levybacteria bacterium]|nr:methyltransferase domain-containing protein [Candidatus Levybacteria bacterium]